ncbi:PLD nuclease N-terminal domain-containing protein [Cellulomonas soli]
MRYLPLVLAIALVVYCVVDIAGSPDEERLGLPRPVWMLLVVVAPFVGAVVWLVVSRSRRAAVARGEGGHVTGRDPREAPPAPRRGRPGPVAPDDDPEFLRRLDQELRRQGQQDVPGAGEPEGDAGGEAGGGAAGQRPE